MTRNRITRTCMISLPSRSSLVALALPALLWSAAAPPARAASSAASEVSGSVSTSFGSSSTSIEKSSDSSSRRDNKLAEGEYTVVALATAPGQPGRMRLQLQALATPGADGELVLLLPQSAAEQGSLHAGQTVTARQRPYGFEFARRDDGQAFFLVLSDDWHRELQTRVVTL